MHPIFTSLLKRKGLLIVIVLIIVGGGYYWYHSRQTGTTAPRYVTAAVTRGTLTVSVSGTGQVSVSNQVDVKPKASGDVTSVFIKNGQAVKAGSLLVQIDSSDEQKSIRDAEANLESAQLSLEKFKQPADELSLTQAENAVAQAQQAKQDAEDALVKAYNDGFTDVSNAFLDFPGLMAGFDDLLFNKDFDQAQWNVDWYASQANVWDPGIGETRDAVVAAYQNARTQYDANFTVYQATSRTADTATIGALISQTTATNKAIADAVKAASNYLNHIQDLMSQHSYTIPQRMASQQTTLNSYTATVNSNLATLTNVLTTLKNSQQSIANAGESINEKQQSLDKLKAGPDPLDLKSQELSLQQRVNALADAREKLADYSVRAPFDGIVAEVDVKVGDPISSGTTVATFVTAQRLAEISLNEVDVAKIKLGQKATLTFDAVPDLTLTGEVVDIASLGTVSQGVVSYTVKIGFDTQDDRIKTGMSVSTAIITDVKQDVLLVPGTAVKTQGQGSYVQVMQNGVPQQRMVQEGLANDTSTEVSGNIQEGDEVVTQTITSSTALPATSTQQRTGTSIIPGLGGGGGAVRFGAGGAGR